MGIMSKAFLLLLGLVTLALALLTLRLWPRLAGHGARPLAGRIGLLLGTQLSLAATFLFTVNAFGGYRVQGRGEEGERLLQDAKSMEAAGAFAVVLECVPAELAARATAALSIPTIGIGAGPDCDAQVLVWQDMAGLTPRTAKFVKKYADVAGVLGQAATGQGLPQGEQPVIDPKQAAEMLRQLEKTMGGMEPPP